MFALLLHLSASVTVKSLINALNFSSRVMSLASKWTKYLICCYSSRVWEIHGDLHKELAQNWEACTKTIMKSEIAYTALRGTVFVTANMPSLLKLAPPQLNYISPTKSWGFSLPLIPLPLIFYFFSSELTTPPTYMAKIKAHCSGSNALRSEWQVSKYCLLKPITASRPKGKEMNREIKKNWYLLCFSISTLK